MKWNWNQCLLIENCSRWGGHSPVVSQVERQGHEMIPLGGMSRLFRFNFLIFALRTIAYEVEYRGPHMKLNSKRVQGGYGIKQKMKLGRISPDM